MNTEMLWSQGSNIKSSANWEQMFKNALLTIPFRFPCIDECL